MAQRRFASGYRQRLGLALHRNAAAMPILLRARPPASAVWWRSNRSAVHYRKPTISPLRPLQNGWHRRWPATRLLHCVFRRAPSHPDCRRAPPGRGDKTAPKASGLFLLLSTQSVGPTAPSAASASRRKPMKKPCPPILRKIFRAMRRGAVCLATADQSTKRQKKDTRHRLSSDISEAPTTAHHFAR